MGRKRRHMVYGKKRPGSKPRQLEKKTTKRQAERQARGYRKRGFHVIVTE